MQGATRIPRHVLGTRADVEIEGDPELQQATRFGLFHVLQAGARAEQRAIAAKGLTGSGYDGHTFWDTEAFVLPVLTYTLPQAAATRCAGGTRRSIAPGSAQTLELTGAAFPWRTIHGEECSGYWPAGTGAFHINADIAAAVVRYQRAAGDEEFEREIGLELLVETARLWRRLGIATHTARFRIDGVTGPDEYSAIADNNVYTNLMAQRNLSAAADTAERYPEVARARRDPGRDSGVARRSRSDGHSLRRAPRCPSAGRAFHATTRSGTSGHEAGAVPAAAALPVLRSVSQAGGQTG